MAHLECANAVAMTFPRRIIPRQPEPNARRHNAISGIKDRRPNSALTVDENEGLAAGVIATCALKRICFVSESGTSGTASGGLNHWKWRSNERRHSQA